ncbi:MAG: GreA/GreB family elongation factor [Bacilli bacterium]|jgi:transcription elongation factor GreA|nr:GreA/GreB family elongation factor [Bacilli bacterium]
MQITKESFEVLKKKLAEAMEANKEIVVEIEEARKQGDLSENADYSAAMDKKRSNDALIADLRGQIDQAEVVGDPTDTSKVAINSIVTLLKVKENVTKVYQIGDSISTDPDKGIISEKSPIGKAIAGHKVGDIVTVEVSHPFQVKIIKIGAVK